MKNNLLAYEAAKNLEETKLTSNFYVSLFPVTLTLCVQSKLTSFLYFSFRQKTRSLKEISDKEGDGCPIFFFSGQKKWCAGYTPVGSGKYRGILWAKKKVTGFCERRKKVTGEKGNQSNCNIKVHGDKQNVKYTFTWWYRCYIFIVGCVTSTKSQGWKGLSQKILFSMCVWDKREAVLMYLTHWHLIVEHGNWR